MAQSIVPNVNPGTVIGSIPTFSTNATLVGDFLYVRDENGNALSGRTVDAGDEVTVLDISASKQLVLLQYPTSRGYVQGYVNNDTNIIKYKNGYNWSNGSTPEPVYDLDKTTQIGSLDPSETAVILYTVDGMTAVVYDTGKGKLTKSGLVQYTGTTNSSGSSSGNGFNGVRPGDVVPGGFTYPNNAEVVGDELYLRDQNGNMIQGRSVSIGDKITVLDVGYTKQLALVQYPAGNVVRQGYVTNAPNLIKYFKPYQWHNGSTEEQVLDENGQHLGSLSKYESATPLYIKNGLTHVVYNTNKGPHTKSGFVRYEGGPAKTISIPYITVSGAEKMEYGKSGLGRPLIAHKIGNGNKALVFVCEVHGFEDNWPNDGLALVTIGNKLIEHLASNGTNGWSVYVIPSANPDGLAEGYTDHGPGRCTIVGGVDINRDFPPGFSKHGSSRNWSGDYPLSVKESKCLSEFLLDIKSKHNELFVIDLHGWEGSALGDQEIKKHFLQQFPGSRSLGFDRRGFLTAWTKEKLDATSALIELPNDTSSLQQVLDRGYPEKIIKAVDSLLSTNHGGNSSSTASSNESSYNETGTVINVQTHLNVRQGPGTEYNLIGKLYQGNAVEIVAKSSSWYKIKFGSEYGYVSSDYIKINYCNNVDKTTITERLVISGSEYNAFIDVGSVQIAHRFKYNFIEPAINELTSFKNKYPSDKITWLISSSGYSNNDIENFKDTAKRLKVNISFFENLTVFKSYINDRVDCKIGTISIFSHGVPGSIEFGYRQSNCYELSFNVLHFKDINPSSFKKNATTISYACNGATLLTPNSANILLPNSTFGKSFADEWYKCGFGKIKACKGKTDYFVIFGDNMDKHVQERSYKGYCENGAVYYPKPSEGAEWIRIPSNEDF